MTDSTLLTVVIALVVISAGALLGLIIWRWTAKRFRDYWKSLS